MLASRPRLLILAAAAGWQVLLLCNEKASEGWIPRLFSSPVVSAQQAQPVTKAMADIRRNALAGCSRIAFGGRPDGGYSCRDVSTTAGKALAALITWPGNEDTGIPTRFGSELPNPFPTGVTSSGTVVVFDFQTSVPNKVEWKLIDPDGKRVETLTLDNKNPYCFVAKDALRSKSKYTVEVAWPQGNKAVISFTTR